MHGVAVNLHLHIVLRIRPEKIADDFTDVFGVVFARYLARTFVLGQGTAENRIGFIGAEARE